MWTEPLLWTFPSILTQETGTDCDSTSINTNLIERSRGGDKLWVETRLKEFGQSLVGVYKASQWMLYYPAVDCVMPRKNYL